MASITCTEAQLRLIQTALDFYSRIGIGQFEEIIRHPTFEKSLHNQFTSKEPLKVGSQTMRGEVVKVTKKSISTKGSWGSGEEIRVWNDLENVKHSPNWVKLHANENEIKNQLNVVRNLLYGEQIGRDGSWGINSPKVDESCRDAFEILKKIRHQFWLINPNRGIATVDSTDGRLTNVKVTL